MFTSMSSSSLTLSSPFLYNGVVSQFSTTVCTHSVADPSVSTLPFVSFCGWIVHWSYYSQNSQFHFSFHRVLLVIQNTHSTVLPYNSTSDILIIFRLGGCSYQHTDLKNKSRAYMGCRLSQALLHSSRLRKTPLYVLSPVLLCPPVWAPVSICVGTCVRLCGLLCPPVSACVRAPVSACVSTCVCLCERLCPPVSACVSSCVRLCGLLCPQRLCTDDRWISCFCYWIPQSFPSSPHLIVVNTHIFETL